MSEPRLRPAAPDDYERVRELTLESKAHWGYDRDFVRRWAEGLSFENDRERWVAELDGVVVAWAALVLPTAVVAWTEPVDLDDSRPALAGPVARGGDGPRA